ncbi:MAG TPA: hypothetical protein VIW07_05870 [Candidatus Udaeobacter sp.]|jgi:hypothetical protein
MDNSLRNQTEIEGLRYERSSSFTESAENNEETTIAMKDADITLGMTVLFLACLALAALAHVIVS